jgi:hypothetical protein
MASLGLPARTNSSSASLNLPASHQARLSNGMYGVSFAVAVDKQSNALLFQLPFMRMGVCAS